MTRIPLQRNAELLPFHDLVDLQLFKYWATTSSVSILFTWYLVCLIKSEFILQIAWSTAGVTPAGTICVCVCGVNPCLSVYVCMCVFVCKRVLAVRPQQYWYCWDRRWAGRFIFGSVTVCQWLQMRRKGKLLDTSKPWSVSLLFHFSFALCLSLSLCHVYTSLDVSYLACVCSFVAGVLHNAPVSSTLICVLVNEQHVTRWCVTAVSNTRACKQVLWCCAAPSPLWRCLATCFLPSLLATCLLPSLCLAS